MSAMQYHEIAEVFPSTDDEQKTSLEEDIRQKGDIFHPIYTFKGRIIDGRNRYEACKSLGIEPKLVEFTDRNKDATELDALEFAISMNLCRRHNDKSRLAATIIDIEALREKYKRKLGILDEPKTNGKGHDDGDGQKADDKEEVQEEQGGDKAEAMAEQFGVNRSYLFQARKIKDEKPDLLEKVKSGEKSLGEAIKELPSVKKKIRDKEKAAAAAGEPIFDDGEIAKGIRTLIGLFDTRAQKMKQNRTPEYKALVEAMDTVAESWKQWQKATT